MTNSPIRDIRAAEVNIDEDLWAKLNDANNQEKFLERFDSNRVSLEKIPKLASQTRHGSIVLKPIVEPVKFNAKKLLISRDTILEFKLDKTSTK